MMPATQSKIIESEQLSSIFVKSGLSSVMNTLAVIANRSIPKLHFENPFQGYPRCLSIYYLALRTWHLESVLRTPQTQNHIFALFPNIHVYCVKRAVY